MSNSAGLKLDTVTCHSLNGIQINCNLQKFIWDQLNRHKIYAKCDQELSSAAKARLQLQTQLTDNPLQQTDRTIVTEEMNWKNISPKQNQKVRNISNFGKRKICITYAGTRSRSTNLSLENPGSNIVASKHQAKQTADSDYKVVSPLIISFKP